MQIEGKEHVTYSYSLTGLTETHLELLAGLMQHVVLGKGDKYREAAYEFLTQLEEVIAMDHEELDDLIHVSATIDDEYGTPVITVSDVDGESDAEWLFPWTASGSL